MFPIQLNAFYLGGISLVIAFIATFFFTKYWIKIARRMGLTGKDMNKPDKRKVAEAGGITVIIAFSLAVLFYIFSKTFFISTGTHMVQAFALLTSMLLAGFLGFTDDILGWKIGLRQWQKPLLTVPIAFPIMAVNAGVSTMSIPFLGPINFGLVYPLLIVPFGIIGAANGFNLIAGFNGLESGQGIIILSTLGFYSWVSGELWLALICSSMVATLLGFLIFNKYPSKVFPGDSLTYSVGALIAIVSILGNMERLGFILFIPYFIEFILKASSRFQAESFGEPTDGKLRNKYDGVFSLNHLVLELKEMKEWKATAVIWFFEFCFAILAFLL